jgi:hypothetical protein
VKTLFVLALVVSVMWVHEQDYRRLNAEATQEEKFVQRYSSMRPIESLQSGYDHVHGETTLLTGENETFYLKGLVLSVGSGYYTTSLSKSKEKLVCINQHCFNIIK